jgi:hypothetical protein
MGVPNTFTLNFFKIPLFESSIPQLRAVCPPKPRRIPSGFSFFITFSTNSGVTGRR